MSRLSKNNPLLKSFQKDVRTNQTFAVVAYGDSWTWGGRADGWASAGTNTDIIPSWITQLKTYLRGLNPNITFTNQGVSGKTSTWGVDNLSANVLALSPKYCILNFGINDWSANNAVPLATYITNMQSIITQLIGVGCTVFIWITGPVATNTESYGYIGTVGNESAYTSKFSDYVQALRNLATTNNVYLLDTRQALIDEWARGTVIGLWLDDPLHFLQKGHDAMFNVALKELIGKKTMAL